MNPIATFWCAFWISLLTKPTAEVIPFPEHRIVRRRA
jgi:hypothetical protein